VIFSLQEIMDAKERKVFNSRPLFYGFLALLVAIASARHIFVGKLDWILIVSFVLLAFLVYCLWAKKYIMLAIIFSVFAFGTGWFFVGLQTFEGSVYTDVCQVEGRVGDSIGESQYGNCLYVVLEDVKINGKTDKNIQLKIYVDDTAQIKQGDVLFFESKINNQKLFELGSFDFSAYRDKTPYEASVDIDNVSIVGSRLTIDEQFRLKAKSVLYKWMGERNGSVAFAVLFGDKSDIDSDIKTAYSETGIIHLLTVSGLHVSFLILLLGFVLKKCRVHGIWNFLVCFLFLTAYAWLCGFSPSVTRAGIMGLVLLSAKLSGKCYDGLNSVGLAGIVLLLIKPLFALDIGFLMSFFCVISIYVISPWLSNFLKKIFPKKVAEAFAISIATQIGILPFMGEIFSTLNFLSFFVNLIVVPFFSVLYPLLFVSLFLVLAMPFLGFVLKLSCWGFDFIFKIAEFFAQTKLKLTLEPINIVTTVLMFLFFYLISRFFMANKKVKAICSGCVLTLFAIVQIAFGLSTPAASITLACNYSDSVVMLTNSNGNTLFVGLGTFSFNRKLMNSNFVKTVDSLVLMNGKDISQDSVSALRCKSIYSLEENLSEGQISVKQEEVVLTGGFAFVYKFYGNDFVGLEISFDETQVFVLNEDNRYLSVEAIESVVSNNYDFVVLGTKDNFAQVLFNKCDKILTYYDNKHATASCQKDGNISYAINGNNLKRRVID